MTPRRIVALGVATLLATVVPEARQTRDSAASAPQPRGSGVISGVVVSDDKPPRPLRRARVTLNDADRTVGLTATTDEAGAFAFRELPAGRYTLQSTKVPFLVATYGAKRPGGTGTTLLLKDGEQLTRLSLTMLKGAVITGSVRDAKNNPVPGVPINVLRFGYNVVTGERSLGNASGTTGNATDDRGMFRFFGLPPGDYLVLARLGPQYSGRPGEPPNDIRRLTSSDIQAALARANSGRAASSSPPVASAKPTLVNYAPIFHPGVTDIDAATTITLGLGEVRDNVDVPLQLVPTASVSGVVTLPPDVAASSVTVTLVRSGQSQELWAGAGVRGTSVQIDAANRYAINSVPPGQYTVKASIRGTGNGRSGPITGPVKPMWAQADVTLAGIDLDVPLTMQPGLIVNGHYEFEGLPAPPPELASGGARAFLVPPGSGGVIGSGGQDGVVDGNGEFTFKGMTPDRYRFLANTGTIRGWWVKTAIANGRDVFDAPIEIRPNETVDLRLVFTQKPTTLAGTLQDTTGRAATDYFIIVFPTDRAAWKPGSRRVASVRPSTDGAFATTGSLPPGEYYLAALTDVDDGAWNDPAFLAQLVPTAVKVTLRDGQTTTQALRIGG